jgi:hypothetical protein
MNNRCVSWLLPMAVLLAPRTATAQIGPISQQQSHRELPGEFDANDVQRKMADRLQALQELHGLQDRVRELLKDRAFVDKFKHVSQPELNQLRAKWLQGEGLQQDPNWKRLLDQVQASRKLDDKQFEALQGLAQRVQPPQTPPAIQKLLDNEKGLSPPSPPPPGVHPSPTLPANAPESSWFDRMEQETTKWFVDHLDDVGEDVLGTLLDLSGKEEGGPLAELMREMRQPDFGEANFNEQMAGIGQYAPQMGEWVRGQRGWWDEVRSVFGELHSSSLPNVRATKSSSAATTGESWTPALMILLMLAVMVLLLTRMKSHLRMRMAGGEIWQLGSWPVSPQGVSTRQDVVRAFEYVALLCLGVSANTCHHRILAERLGDNPARRLAAETLAWLYEKARYAPAEDTLTQDELTDARHALCLLAGVTAP